MNRKLLIVLLMSLSSIASGQTLQDPSLRAELLSRLGADQEVRRIHMTEKLQRGPTVDIEDIKAMNAVDSANTEWMRALVKRLGWPAISRVGADGEEAAFLLVQHADRDTAFQSRCLLLLLRAYQEKEATGEQLALLTDRVEVAAGRPQVYGSQAWIGNDSVIFRPILDSPSVDERRAHLGLMPLDE
jgi:hypothetical protein